ncbi:hypothetical protein MVEN_00714800 [Mycena venus]|uniref:DUF6533 domain-containing protein n=1 Tax=Mycena venus TaxID=2733690 RepID=A0A8H7D5Q4_9AGAR|nr:hypothetical protein MVEN_00714800 [Mycena venus]
MILCGSVFHSYFLGADIADIAPRMCDHATLPRKMQALRKISTIERSLSTCTGDTHLLFITDSLSPSYTLFMSSQAIDTATTHFLRFRLQYSSLALLYYDYALTFPREVQYIWKQKFRLSTALYIGCRYALVANVLYLLAIANKLGHTVGFIVLLCDFWYKIVGALSVLGRLCVIVLFTLRSSAVFGRSKWITTYMSVVGLACIALDIVSLPLPFSSLSEISLVFRPMYQGSVVRGLLIFPSVSFEALTHLQCIELVSAPEMLSITTIIFETSSTLFTAIRCIQALRAMKKVERKRYSVMSILLEQGVLFFCSISIFTVTGVILQYRAPPGFFQRLPNAFTLPLSCTLTARFILHLRKWYATQLNDSKDGVKSESVVFQSQSSMHSETALTGMVAMEDFGPDPVVLAAATGTNRMEIQLTHVLHRVPRENEADDHCAAGQPCLARRENEIV